MDKTNGESQVPQGQMDKRPILIFFYGEADIGKTTTLKKLAAILHERCTRYVETRKVSDSRDVKIVLTYKNGLGEVLIGTAGDNNDEIKNNLRFFLEQVKDKFCVCITAARELHDARGYKNDEELCDLLQHFQCIDISRNGCARRKNERKEVVGIQLVRADTLFIYVQELLRRKKLIPPEFLGDEGVAIECPCEGYGCRFCPDVPSISTKRTGGIPGWQGIEQYSREVYKDKCVCKVKMQTRCWNVCDVMILLLLVAFVVAFLYILASRIPECTTRSNEETSWKCHVQKECWSVNQSVH